MPLKASGRAMLASNDQTRRPRLWGVVLEILRHSRNMRPLESSLNDSMAYHEKASLPRPPNPVFLKRGKSLVPISTPSGQDRKDTRTSNEKPKKPRIWSKFIEEYRKNYCPRTSPPLVLPSSPTDVEKYSYVGMKRPFLVSCALLAFLSLAFGAWNFVRFSVSYAWFAVYVFIGQFYLLASLFISVIGKELDLPRHQKLLKDYPLTETQAPSVDVYLPVCHEPIELLENTWTHITALQYPKGRISIYVLDDGADDSVKSLAQDFKLNYICRPNRPELKKAGNLRHAFAQTSGDFFVVFDADFCPRADFLLETMPYALADKAWAILQTPQFFRSTGDKTWTEQGAGASQEYIYRIMQTCRDRWQGAMCVGSNAVYRRSALEPIGGTIPASSSEDIQTGFYVVTQGWTLKFLPLVLACGTCPNTPRAFFSQQVRWGDGTLALCIRRDFWSSGGLSARQKLCYMTGFLYYATTAVQPFLSSVPAPLILWTRPQAFKYYYVFFGVPSIVLEVGVLKLWTRGRYTLSVQYTRLVQSYAYMHAIWDLIARRKMSWNPSGDSKAHKDHRYRNMRVLAWAWTITQMSVLASACVLRIVQGLKWYNIMPLLVIEGYNLLCVHRFLVYRHAKH